MQHRRGSAQALEVRVVESQSRQQQLQGELGESRSQAAQLQAELEQQRQTQVPVADGSAAEPAPASPLTDPEHGLAEMLEALAGAEARLTRQAEEIVVLHQSLAQSLRQRQKPPPAAARPLQAADMEVIASLTQELRQPMSSIIGYVDPLLSESVGIIGALQRKFLVRIKASSERNGVLLDDLMPARDIDSGNLKLAQDA